MSIFFITLLSVMVTHSGKLCIWNYVYHKVWYYTSQATQKCIISERHLQYLGEYQYATKTPLTTTALEFAKPSGDQYQGCCAGYLPRDENPTDK